MKNLLKLTVVAVFGMVALSSCKKDWTCDCTGTSNGVSVDLSNYIVAPILPDLSKKDAQTACDSHATSLQALVSNAGDVKCTAVEKN